MREYITSRPVGSALIGRIESLLPRHARSVTALYSDDGRAVRYRSHRSETVYVRRAVRLAKAEASIRED